MISLINYKIKLSYVATILIFFSMGVNPSFLSNNISSFDFITNFIRFFLPSIFLIGYFLFFKKENLFEFLNTDILIKIIFLIFTIILVFSLFFDFFNPQNLYFLSYLNIFLFISILSLSFDREEIKNNIILFVILGLFISLFLFLIEIFNNPFSFSELHKFKILSYDARFLSQALPRSTGIAKFLLFVIIILLILPRKKNTIANLVLLIFFSSLLILFRSRTNILFFTIFLICYLFYFSQDIRIKIQIFFATIIIPVIIFITIPENKISLIEENFNKSLTPWGEYLEVDYRDIIIRKNTTLTEKLYGMTINKTTNIYIKNNNTQLEEIENISSGRTYLWKKFFEDLKKNEFNLFIGKGILADKKFYNQSISNGFFYSLLSGGLVIFLLYIIVNIVITINILKNIIKSREISENIFPYSILIYLMFRSLFENGYLLYISDLYLFLISIILTTSKTLKN